MSAMASALSPVRPPGPPHQPSRLPTRQKQLACQHLSCGGRWHLELSLLASGGGSEEEYVNVTFKSLQNANCD